MIITTKFDIGQTIYRMVVSRVVVTGPCPVCAGEGGILTTAADGSEHRLRCPKNQYTRYTDPDEICYSGRVRVGREHRREEPVPLTVGQVQVTVGPRREEVVMCEETGIGSGTIHSVTPRPINYSSRGSHFGVFGTAEEAVRWGDWVVRECNWLLELEGLHVQAIEEDAERYPRDTETSE